MKKIITVIGILFLIWSVWSWAEVVTKNATPNETSISSLNLFNLMIDEPKDSRSCDAWITDIGNNIVTFEDESGNIWTVNDAFDESEIGQSYELIFDTCNTKTIYDDRIIAYIKQ